MGANLWSVLGLVFATFAALIIILAFSTSNWLETDEGTIAFTNFEKIGLWEACFDGYQDARDGFGRIYSGCRWMFSREYDKIRKWILPGWFVTTQALMTVNVVLALLSALFGLLVLLTCFPENTKKYVVLTIFLACFTIGACTAGACVLFGTHGDTDRSWLKHPSRRHLSWSFYCAVIGGLVSLLAGMMYVVYYMKIRKAGRNATAYRAYEMRSYRSQRY